jgi:hypothetical protein
MRQWKLKLEAEGFTIVPLLSRVAAKHDENWTFGGFARHTWIGQYGIDLCMDKPFDPVIKESRGSLSNYAVWQTDLQ